MDPSASQQQGLAWGGGRQRRSSRGWEGGEVKAWRAPKPLLQLHGLGALGASGTAVRELPPWNLTLTLTPFQLHGPTMTLTHCATHPNYQPCRPPFPKRCLRAYDSHNSFFHGALQVVNGGFEPHLVWADAEGAPTYMPAETRCCVQSVWAAHACDTTKLPCWVWQQRVGERGGWGGRGWGA